MKWGQQTQKIGQHSLPLLEQFRQKTEADVRWRGLEKYRETKKIEALSFNYCSKLALEKSKRDRKLAWRGGRRTRWPLLLLLFRTGTAGKSFGQDDKEKAKIQESEKRIFFPLKAFLLSVPWIITNLIARPLLEQNLQSLILANFMTNILILFPYCLQLSTVRFAKPLSVRLQHREGREYFHNYLAQIEAVQI